MPGSYDKCSTAQDPAGHEATDYCSPWGSMCRVLPELNSSRGNDCSGGREGGRPNEINRMIGVMWLMWMMWHRCSICRKQSVARSNLGSCCATTYCLFHCIVAACNSALVLPLIASVDPVHPLVIRLLSPPWPAFSGSKHLSLLGFSRNTK